MTLTYFPVWWSIFDSRTFSEHGVEGGVNLGLIVCLLACLLVGVFSDPWELYKQSVEAS